MRCPAECTEPLVMTDRSGIEIDYCPNCRGVWLDRGELDKIIERSAAPTATPTARSAPPHDRDDRHDDRYDGRRRKKERGGFLGELFEF